MQRTGSQRGSAMLVTMIIIAALLAGGGVLAKVQLSGTRSTGLHRTSIDAQYCAEAGLAAARPVVAASYAQWGTALAASGAATPDTSEPAWLAAGIGSHDLDGDGVADFTVYIKDDVDELPPADDDPTRDQNLRVYIVATCLRHPETPTSVEELVQLAGGGTCYKTQIGGCRNDNNEN